MCGIVGLIADNPKEYVDYCTTLLHHRGPDDRGVYATDKLALGHTRLAILDLSPNGHQPMFSADRRFVIVFNGEIYNHLELRNALKDRYTFRSTSDTETLLYGFAAYGPAVFNKLNGIFACAIYDTHLHELTLARDPFGVKPLYYYHHKGQFLFSSELKAMANYPGVDKALDYEALANYLHFLYSPGSQTPFRHVCKLLPGHLLRIQIDRPETIQLERYYELPFDGIYSPLSEVDLLNELDERLFQAVKRQLQSDVPLGFFLSGGLDSSIVVAMAKRARPHERLTCYTIQTAGGGLQFDNFADDLRYARQAASHLKVELIGVEAEAAVVRDFDQMIYYLDEPQADTAPIHVLNICRTARKNGHTVLLSGAAGDDLFSGYRRHQALAMEPMLSRIPAGVGQFLQRTFGAGHSNRPLTRRIRKITSGLGQSSSERMADYFAWLPVAINRKLFQPPIRDSLQTYQPNQQLLQALARIPKEISLLNQMLFWELNYFLPDHNLNYTDKLSMAVGVEVRVPFLDKELVEFSARLPPSLKMRGTTTKYLLRKLAERYLPHSVIYRSKSGFGTPLRDWILSGQLAGMTSHYLSEESLRQREIFDPVAVRNLMENNQRGKIDASYTIWGLMAMESWFRQFVD
ncbi:asparagine synthase (glutamine-hydrolyzing) [Larkinella bovis]|uniref:asparagine synthase (glutamine-hydrolyzing) n=1 Tax=Larkinella bovis TaxID=683041 RepID=A0ABW0I705_9BACT